MTIKLPEKKTGIGDRVLKLFGKERQLVVPKDIYQKYGQYAYAQAKYEGFWKALV